MVSPTVSLYTLIEETYRIVANDENFEILLDFL